MSFSFQNCWIQRLDFVFWEKKIPLPGKLALLQNYGFELNLKFDVETPDCLVTSLSCGDDELEDFGRICSNIHKYRKEQYIQMYYVQIYKCTKKCLIRIRWDWKYSRRCANKFKSKRSLCLQSRKHHHHHKKVWYQIMVSSLMNIKHTKWMDIVTVQNMTSTIDIAYISHSLIIIRGKYWF